MNKVLTKATFAIYVLIQILGAVASAQTALDPSQVRGLAASATTDATNAGNISSGTLSNSRLTAIPNSALANSSITLNAGAGLTTTSASIPLGSSATMNRSISINAQTGTTYTVSNTDQAKLLTFNNSASVQVTLPHAGASGQFTANWFADFQNLGNGAVTISPAGGSTIGSSSHLTLGNNQGARIVSDGTNYQVFGLPTINLAASGLGGVMGLLPASGVSGLAASATTDTTNASNIGAGTLAASRLPSSISSNTTGNAATATALSATPTTCSSAQAATGVDIYGNAVGCFTPAGGSGLQPPGSSNVLLKYSSGTTTVAAVAGTDYQAPSYTASGPGAQSRSVSGKLQELVSVTDFGADPTGAHDSTAAFNNALSSACPVSVRIPAGTYLISSQLTISCVGTNLIGDGSRVVVLNFNPASTATALFLENSNPSIELAQNRISGFTLNGQGSAVKTGIDMVDTEEVTIRDVSCVGNSSNGSWHDSNNSSRCLFTQGRQGLWIENFYANADLPIEIGHNPRSGSIQIDIDQSTFHNLYLIGNASTPCVTIDDNTLVTQVTFSGMQSYVACSRAFSWVATTNAVTSNGLTIKDDPRWEQSTSSDYFVYISLPSSGRLYNFKIENWNEGSTNHGGNGFYFRNVAFPVITNGTYQDSNTFVNVDNSVFNLYMANNFVASGSTVPQAGITAGAAAGTNPTLSITGNAQNGKITLTTGTSTGTGTLATVTFPNSYWVAPNCLVASNGTTNGTVLQSLGWTPSTTGLTLYSYGNAPAGSTTYTINYSCSNSY